MVRTVGWDVGGAHLKAALAENGRVLKVFQEATPLWRGLESLDAAVAAIVPQVTGAEHHGVTMTGELADVFDTRPEGVASLAALMAERLGPGTRLYAGARGFVPPAEASEASAAIASANWHATARFIATTMDEALLVDMGSTTTDIVPVADGTVLARGTSDAERMEAGELVYVGYTRTALMALGAEMPFAGRRVPVMNELFATMADALRAAGALDEDDDLQDAADGKAKTLEASRARLARMIGRDAAEASPEAWADLGRAFVEAAIRRVHDAALVVLSRAEVSEDASIVVAGTGRPLLRRVASRLDRGLVDFADLVECRDELRDAVRRAAPAAAVALLASKE